MERQPAQHAELNQMQQQDGEREIDLIELGYALLDKLKYIVLAAVLGLIAAAVYTFAIAVPQYQAVAKIYVLNSDDSIVNLSDLQIGNYLASDYTEVFKTWEVNEMVRTNLGLTYSYGKMNSMVSVTNPSGTRILYITVKSSDPQEATDMANEYAKVVSDYVSTIMATKRPNMLSQAIVPTSAVSPQKSRNLMLGVLIGALLAAAIIVVRFVLDDSVKSADDVTKLTGLPVLAIVPMANGKTGSKNKEYAYTYAKTERSK